MDVIRLRSGGWFTYGVVYCVRGNILDYRSASTGSMCSTLSHNNPQSEIVASASNFRNMDEAWSYSKVLSALNQ